MTGIQIQYLLGIFFLVNSVSLSSGKIVLDIVKLIAGIVLLFLAITGMTFI